MHGVEHEVICSIGVWEYIEVPFFICGDKRTIGLSTVARQQWDLDDEGMGERRQKKTTKRGSKHGRKTWLKQRYLLEVSSLFGCMNKCQAPLFGREHCVR